jgi:hypothetical protein
MGREARVVKIRDPLLPVKIAESLAIINQQLARTQLALILHGQDRQPIADEARRSLDFAVDALLKLEQMFREEGSR